MPSFRLPRRRAAAAAAPAPAHAPGAVVGDRLTDRAEALATRRGALLALAGGAALLLLMFVVRPTFPNYDSYYTLVWGGELAAGRLPDYDVFRTPTPHPLATLVGAALAWLGDAADRTLVLITLAAWLALVASLFRLTQLLLGTVVAAVATLVVLTRTDLWFYSLRAVVDIPFLALVFCAAVLELRRPRRGLAVLVLLVLAGLLRPEAWVLAGLYWLWLVPGGLSVRRLAAYAALAAAGPLMWLGADWAVTGEPLYSLTSTREVAGEFGRQRTLADALLLLPDYLGANEKIVNVIAGGLGGLLALWLLRRRIALPLALAGAGLLVFLAIAAAGLSVIPRYLAIPSLFLNLCVGVALAGWTVVREPRARQIAIGIAAIAVLLIGWRAPSYLRDANRLAEQTAFVRDQHRELDRLLDHAEVGPLLALCRPVTTPTHSAIPVIRLRTGLPKAALEASIAQRGPPQRGVLLLGRSFNFEPVAARSVVSSAGTQSARKWWSNYPLSSFRPVTGNAIWRASAQCR